MSDTIRQKGLEDRVERPRIVSVAPRLGNKDGR